jgi:asparagine synthase (glutamine-hydrolysing)
LRRAAALPSLWLHSDNAFGRKLHRASLDVAGRHLEGMSFFVPRELQPVLSREMRRMLAGHDPYAAARAIHAGAAKGLGDLPALLYLDSMTYLTDDVLVKVDRTSMQHSLEARVPLLDHKVMEFVARIPFEYKLREGRTKWILRECVKDLLPPEILARGKQGFAVPLERWFGDDFGRLAREVLYDPRVRSRGWLDARGLQSLIERPHARDARQARQVWALVCLELWAQTALDRPAELADRPLEAGPLSMRAPSASSAA